MRVFMASTSYPAHREDWRGRFIYDMTESLALRNDIELQVWCPPGDLPDKATNAASKRDRAWLAELSAQGGIAHLLRKHPIAGLFEAARLLARLRKAIQEASRVDVVHCNWLQTSLSLWRLDRPALITVLGSDMRLLKLPGMTTLLRRVLAQRRSILAPNAEWMVPDLTSRFGDVCTIVHVPFGVDKYWFDTVRIPAIPARWLVVTRLTRDKIGSLFEWGESATQADHEIHLFGPMQETMTIPSWIHYHGATHPREMRERWFPHAAGLITLSQHAEGRPQVMLEAMAAGLPIIASDMPAHRDFIQHECTGMLVNSADALLRAMDSLAATEANRRIGRAAQQWAKQHAGTWDDCAERYRRLYGQLVQVPA